MAEDAELCKKVEQEFIKDRDENIEQEYENLLKRLISIANPLASYKMCKSICRLIRKATKNKKCSRGTKAVNKALRKKIQGIVILAGDITPIDLISHYPIWCETMNIPYVYIPSSIMLSNAMEVIGQTACVMIHFDESYDAKYKKLSEKITKLPFPISYT